MPIEPQAVKAIFLAAIDLSNPVDRAAFLDQACGPDAALRQRVEALLRAHDRGSPFLDVPAVAWETEGAGGPENEPAAAADAGAVCPGAVSLGVPFSNAAGPSPELSFLEPPPRQGVLGRLGHYEVLDLVGVGGMGLVLRAFDQVLHRVVAIKVLAPHLAASLSARRRFLGEARAAAAVSHDHVVTIHAVEEAGQVPFLVMQYIAGKSLEDKLRQSGPLGLKEVLRIGLQTAEGLAAAHAQGLVHRDIKPANILLENSLERVKITDFGLARSADDTTAVSSDQVAGTPQYMSPEQARGLPVDHRSDLFSLGSVLYTMCTGRPAFQAETHREVLRRVCEETPRPIHETNPTVPEWLCAVIGRLHARDPEARFQSAQEVADLLRSHLAREQQAGVAADSSTGPQPSPRQGPHGRRWPWSWLSLVARLATLS